MSHVSYNSSRLIPSPFVSLQRNYQRTPDGTLIGTSWSGQISGTIVSFKGSPRTNGTFWQVGGYPPDEVIGDSSELAAIIRKQEAIRELFAVDGYVLQWQSEDASAPMQCYPTITGISFEESIWYFECKFTINFECQILYINGTASGEDNFTNYISDASESWQVETDEGTPADAVNQRTYRVTHNLSATGKRIYDGTGNVVENAYLQAKSWATSRLGYNASFISNVSDAGGSTYNYVRSETTGVYDGQYSVSETWILSKSPVLEEFTVESKVSIENGLTNVGINGSIKGLENRDANLVLVTTKYQNALNSWNIVSNTLLSRAQLYSGVNVLNPLPINSSVAYNPVNGIITYSYEYDNRPTELLVGSRSEVISITDSLNTDVVAIIPVLGRKVGPVLQNINTSRERTRTLNIEAVFPVSQIISFVNPIPALAASIISQINPTQAFGASQVYLVENSQNWDARNARGTINQVWVYEI